MKKNMVWIMGLAAAAGGLFFGTPVEAIEVLKPGYVVEPYVTFECANERPPTGMVFDPGGNLYVIHTREVTGKTGSIYRVDTERNVTQWITGLTRPLDIVWGGGTSYGDYLYLVEGNTNAYWDKGGVSRIGLDGTVSKFSGSGANLPAAIGIDTTGNYGGYMYIGNSAWDNMQKVLHNGQIQSFSGFPYNLSGSPSGIAFDERGNYGGLMYVSVYTGTSSQWRGLNTLDAGGNPAPFAPDIINAGGLAFDTTGEENFGGYLYAIGAAAAGTPWYIYCVYPNGEIETFLTDLKGQINMTFGPDGFLYVMESTWGSRTAAISRIVPRNPLLFKLEEAMALKEEAREKIEQAIIMEQDVLDAVDDLCSPGDPNGWRPVDIVLIKVKVALSMLQEKAAKHHLNKSIDRLQEAWMIIANKDEFEGLPPQTGGYLNRLKRADLNEDGVVNALDFAILSQFWLQTYKK